MTQGEQWEIAVQKLQRYVSSLQEQARLNGIAGRLTACAVRRQITDQLAELLSRWRFVEKVDAR